MKVNWTQTIPDFDLRVEREMSENKVFPKKRALLWSGLCLSICKKSEISWPNLLPYVLLYLFSRANIGGFPAKKQMAANPLLEGIGNCHTPKYIAFDEKWGFEVVPLLANTPGLGSFQFIALEEKWSVEVLFCPLLPSSLDRSQVLKLFHGYSNVLACKTGCSILWLTCVVGIWTVKYVEAALHRKDVGSVRLCYFLSPLGKPLYPVVEKSITLLKNGEHSTIWTVILTTSHFFPCSLNSMLMMKKKNERKRNVRKHTSTSSV